MAAFALTAVVASAAQAAPEFHVENASSTMPAEIEGEQIGAMETSTVNGAFTCNVTTFRGTSTVTGTVSQTLTPTYEGCIYFGEPTTINTNGCTYTFNLVKASSPPTANTNINCPLGKAITTVASGGCTTTLGAQTGKPHVVFTNTGTTTTRDLDASFTVEGLTYTASGCIFNGTFNTGKLNGEATFRAYTEGVQQGLWVV
jgi:hypothetical protein